MPRTPDRPDEAAPPLGGAGLDTFAGTVTSAVEPRVLHRFVIRCTPGLAVTGTAHWPGDAALGLEPRRCELVGRREVRGRVEFSDDGPERLPGTRRGLYAGRTHPVDGHLRGEYYELDEGTNTLFYRGDWTARR